MKILLITLFLSAVCLAGLSAQQALPATGGEASGSGGTVSYTVGQLNYTTQSTANGILSSGLQQTYEVSVVSGMEVEADISLSIGAYPNPTMEQLTIEVEQLELKPQKLHYSLYDLSGRLIQQKEMTGAKTSLQTDKLIPATYILKVSTDKKTLKIFRILKK